MNVNRREFVSWSAAAGALAALAPATQAFSIPDPAAKAQLNLSCQEGVASGKSLTEKLDFLEANGFVGFEPGGGGLSRRVEELQKALQGRKIKISAICAGFSGVPISSDEAQRQKATASIKEILTAAGALGSVGMIIVPAFNGAAQMPHWEAREYLVKTLLPDLGEHAQKAGTRILLEPLNRGEAHFLRQLADAASICRDVNHPGITLMGDFWHMTKEETSDMGAFISAGKYLRHVHLASRRTRKMPGDDGAADNYVDGLRGLKAIGYQDYISLECGSKGDSKVSIPIAAKLMRDQWEQA